MMVPAEAAAAGFHRMVEVWVVRVGTCPLASNVESRSGGSLSLRSACLSVGQGVHSSGARPRTWKVGRCTLALLSGRHPPRKSLGRKLGSLSKSAS
eukprot:4974818-Amphidinium_carterae.1